MIACFPQLYHDELIYSQLSRYYVQSGYLVYRCAAEDLYANKTVRPDIEFLNELSKDAFDQATKSLSIETIIEKHTMYPLYSRFLPVERRKNAFQALVSMKGNYRNLMAIPRRKTNRDRYVRYCPLCAADDRVKYGETYWHRSHQMTGVNVCSAHSCYLKESESIISGAATPTLITAEESVPYSNEYALCDNELELRLAKYVENVFNSDINMESDVLVGSFLHSKMEGTQYRSVRGQQRNIALFHADFIKYYESLPENWLTELWQLQKIITNDRVNFVEICMVAMFLEIPASDLVSMTLPVKTQEQLFDEEIHRLIHQGWKYPKIAKELNVSLSTVKTAGKRNNKVPTGKQNHTSSHKAKTKDWESMDVSLVKDVKSAIAKLQGSASVRPKRVTVHAVEKMLNLRPKQIEHLPLCKAEINKHRLSQNEYWAKEVVWAAQKVDSDGKVMNWKNIKTLTNMRRENLWSCMPYLSQYTDDETLIAAIAAL